MFNIEFNQDQLNFILAVLGELPTKTGAYTVIAHIQSQIPQPAPQEVVESAE